MDLKAEVVRIRNEAYYTGQRHLLDAIEAVLGKELGKFGVVTLDELRNFVVGLRGVIKKQADRSGREE